MAGIAILLYLLVRAAGQDQSVCEVADQTVTCGNNNESDCLENGCCWKETGNCNFGWYYTENCPTEGPKQYCGEDYPLPCENKGCCWRMYDEDGNEVEGPYCFYRDTTTTADPEESFCEDAEQTNSCGNNNEIDCQSRGCCWREESSSCTFGYYYTENCPTEGPKQYCEENYPLPCESKGCCWRMYHENGTKVEGPFCFHRYTTAVAKTTADTTIEHSSTVKHTPFKPTTDVLTTSDHEQTKAETTTPRHKTTEHTSTVKHTTELKTTSEAVYTSTEEVSPSQQYTTMTTPQSTGRVVFTVLTAVCVICVITIVLLLVYIIRLKSKFNNKKSDHKHPPPVGEMYDIIHEASGGVASIPDEYLTTDVSDGTENQNLYMNEPVKNTLYVNGGMSGDTSGDNLNYQMLNNQNIESTDAMYAKLT